MGAFTCTQGRKMAVLPKSVASVEIVAKLLPAGSSASAEYHSDSSPVAYAQQPLLSVCPWSQKYKSRKPIILTLHPTNHVFLIHLTDGASVRVHADDMGFVLRQLSY